MMKRILCWSLLLLCVDVFSVQSVPSNLNNILDAFFSGNRRPKTITIQPELKPLTSEAGSQAVTNRSFEDVSDTDQEFSSTKSSENTAIPSLTTGVYTEPFLNFGTKTEEPATEAKGLTAELSPQNETNRFLQEEIDAEPELTSKRSSDTTTLPSMTNEQGTYLREYFEHKMATALTEPNNRITELTAQSEVGRSSQDVWFTEQEFASTKFPEDTIIPSLGDRVGTNPFGNFERKTTEAISEPEHYTSLSTPWDTTNHSLKDVPNTEHEFSFTKPPNTTAISSLETRVNPDVFAEYEQKPSTFLLEPEYSITEVTSQSATAQSPKDDIDTEQELRSTQSSVNTIFTSRETSANEHFVRDFEHKTNGPLSESNRHTTESTAQSKTYGSFWDTWDKEQGFNTTKYSDATTISLLQTSADEYAASNFEHEATTDLSESNHYITESTPQGETDDSFRDMRHTELEFSSTKYSHTTTVSSLEISTDECTGNNIEHEATTSLLESSHNVTESTPQSETDMTDTEEEYISTEPAERTTTFQTSGVFVGESSRTAGRTTETTGATEFKWTTEFYEKWAKPNESEQENKTSTETHTSKFESTNNPNPTTADAQDINRRLYKLLLHFFSLAATQFQSAAHGFRQLVKQFGGTLHNDK